MKRLLQVGQRAVGRSPHRASDSEFREEMGEMERKNGGEESRYTWSLSTTERIWNLNCYSSLDMNK